MTVDLSKIRVGDTVTVELEWGGDANGKHWVKPYTAHDSYAMAIPASAIVSHTPRPLTVGDRVRPTWSGGGPGYIRAIMDRRAWVDLVDDANEQLNGAVIALSDLERLP